MSVANRNPNIGSVSPDLEHQSTESVDSVEEEYRVTLASYMEVEEETSGEGLPGSEDLVELLETVDQSYAVIDLSEENYFEEEVDPKVYLELGEKLEQSVNSANINQSEFVDAALKLRNVERMPGVSRADESIFEYRGELLE